VPLRQAARWARCYFSRIASGRKMGYAYEITAPGARSASTRKTRTRSGSTNGRAGGVRGFRKILTGPAHPDYLPFCQGPGHGTGYQDQIIIEARDFLAAIDTGRPSGRPSATGSRSTKSWRRPSPRHGPRPGKPSKCSEGSSNMTIQIGNAPCSWGVEFPNDPRNPAWRTGARPMRGSGLHRHRAGARRLHAGRPCGPRRGA
jgi:hypothetical protein